MVTSRKKLDFWFWVKVVVIGFMLIFLIYPFCTLITRSFFSNKTAGFTFENYIRFFTKKYYYSALGRSLFVSIVTTCTTLLVGVPIAYIMSRYNVFGKSFIHLFIIMSLKSPPFIGAYSWIMLFGRAGFVTRLFANIGIHLPSIYGKLGIILVFTFKLFPYVYLYTSGAMGSIDSSIEEAAENLGSNKLRRLLTITLPVVAPSIAAGAIMVFMTSLADFGTPMLIGEGYMVLPVLVYNEYMSEIGGNAHLASALSVVVVLCSTTVLLVQKYFVSRKNYVMTAMRPPKEEVLHGGKRFLVTLPVLLVTLIGISLIVAFNKQPVILTGTAMIMIIAFIVRKLPYTVRSGSAFLQQMDVSVEEASISLGVSPMKTFVNVTARLMAPGVLSGAILSWITCINELSSSVMLYGGKTSTISVAIYTEVVRNSFGTAAALASILTVSTVISLLIFLKVSKGRVSVV